MRPLFENRATLDFLNVKESLPGEAGEVRRFNIAEIREQFGFEYHEHIMVPPDISAPPAITLDDLPAEVRSDLAAPLNETLMVCKISDEVGYGVFTTAPIEAGRIICVYAGGLAPRNDHDIYAMRYTRDFGISAGTTGGVARFFQHFPSDHNRIRRAVRESTKEEFVGICMGNGLPLSDDEISLLGNPEYLQAMKQKIIKEILEKATDTATLFSAAASTELSIKYFLKSDKILPILAVANLAPLIESYKGIDIIVIRALRRIEAYEQLGISYGVDYWIQKRVIPRYFNRMTGKIIPRSEYLEPLGTLVERFRKSDPSITPEIALRRAAAYGYEDAVPQLLEYGVDVNAAAPTSRKTALHWAAENEHAETKRILLTCGADITLRDSTGKTPLDYEDAAEASTCSMK